MTHKAVQEFIQAAYFMTTLFPSVFWVLSRLPGYDAGVESGFAGKMLIDQSIG